LPTCTQSEAAELLAGIDKKESYKGLPSFGGRKPILPIGTQSEAAELLKGIPDKKATSGSGRCSLPENISWKTSHEAQKIAKNPDNSKGCH